MIYNEGEKPILLLNMQSKKTMFDQKQKPRTYDYEKILKLAEEIKKLTEEETRKYGDTGLHERRGVEGENRG